MEWQKWAIIIGAIVAGGASFDATLLIGGYQAVIGAVIVLIGALVK